MKQKVNSVIAVMLAVIILCASSYTVISYAAETYKTAAELESQSASTNNDNVEVDVYYAGNKHTKTINITQTEKVYVKVAVKNAGYLENAKIDFSNCNFDIENDESNTGKIQSLDKQNKVIVLNKIVAGNEVEIALNISPIKAEKVSEDNFKKDNTINMSGTYINEKAKEVQIRKEITLHTSWHGEPTGKISQEVVKYIPYENNGTKELLVQAEVTTEVKNSLLPIKTTQVEVEIPAIKATKPSRVMVYAKGTEATNGESTGISFTSENYSYNEESGKVIINVSNNADENGKISWIKNSKDIYEVIMIYPEAAISEGTPIVEFSGKVTNTYYNDVETNSNAEAITREALGNRGTIADFEGGIIEEKTAKGYMYNGVEIIYNEKYAMSTSNAEITDEMSLNINNANFVKDEAIEISAENNIYNKIVKVEMAELKKILGESGKIEIISNSSVIGTIDVNTKTDENGIAQANISTIKAGNIEIKTSKPQIEGIIRIEVEKGISAEITTSLSERKSYREIKQTTTGKAKSAETEITTADVTDTMKLEEPTAKGAISINKETLSTVVGNDVEITALLETDSADDCLYENPTITIELPSEIESINVTNVEVLHTKELELKEYKVIAGENGKYIQISLNGIQTKYSDNVTKGINVFICANLTINRATPSGTSQIGMAYGEYSQDIGVFCAQSINIVAPTGLVTVNEISGYSAGGEKISVVNDESKTGTLDYCGESRVATIKGEIINNYNYDILYMSIIGRIPNEYNMEYEQSEVKMGDTINTKLTGPISITGVGENYTIYYSQNGGATKSLSEESNGWTTNPQDYSTIKSYLIIINKSLNKSENISWTYNMEIPGELIYNRTINSNYKVYYMLDDENSMDIINKDSPKIVLETGAGPELKVSLSTIDANNGDSIGLASILTFDAVIENIGKESVTNVVVNIPLPEHMQYEPIYAESASLNETTNTIESAAIEEIKAGGKKKIKIALKATEVGKASISASVSSNELTKVNAEGTYEFNIINADISLYNYYPYIYDKVAIGREFTIKSHINNMTTKDLKNVLIKYELPEGLKYTGYFIISEEIDLTFNFLEEKNQLELNIDTLPVGECLIEIDFVAETITNEMRIISKSEINNVTYISNVIELETEKTEYKVSSNAIGATTIEGEENFTSEFVLENIGEALLASVTAQYNIPDYTQFVSATITYMEREIELKVKEETNTIEFRGMSIAAEEKVIFRVTLKADVNEDNKDRKIESYINFSGSNSFETTSDKIVFTVKGVEKEEPGNNETNSTTNEEGNNEINNPGEGDSNDKYYKITGKHWIDENKNGKYDVGEELVQKTKVILIDKSNGTFVLETITNNEGEYTLSTSKKGEYLVAFVYDSKTYKPTDYKKEGISDLENSDVINKAIEYNGEEKIVALTDTIQITETDVNNIDFGMYKVEIFDLSLEKYINKITVNSGSNLKEYNYERSAKTLAKVEIKDKQMAGSTIIIEYKIVVKNEGEVAGYATKIVDYVDEDLKFSTELNPTAYVGKDGNIYSEELSNVLINPGESKEITLILTKKMTSNNTGTIINTAEISESYNELGIADVNSIEGNKDEKENDLGIANVIVSVKTGQIVVYITLTLIVISILAVGIFIIKKEVVDK